MKKILKFLFIFTLIFASLAIISNATSGTCGDNVTWTLENGTLIISGEGNMTNWSNETKVPWYSQRDNIVSLVIEEGVESIGRYSFYNCTSLMIAEIADSVSEIGALSFYCCNELLSIELPESTTKIGELSFYECSKLQEITIGNKVTEICADAFYGCSYLESICYSGNKIEWNKINKGKNWNYNLGAYTSNRTYALYCLENSSLTSLSIDDVVVRPSQTVKIPVVLSNNVGLTGLQISLSYPEFLELIEVETTDVLSNLDFTTSGDELTNPIRFMWDGYDKEDESEGTLLTLVFKADDVISDGEYDIVINVEDAYDYNIETVEIETQNATITVVQYIPGDVNGDGVVTTRDVTVLRRYIAGGYDVEVLEPTLDINGDGIVTTRDVTVLRRYITGGYGIELERPTTPPTEDEEEEVVPVKTAYEVISIDNNVVNCVKLDGSDEIHTIYIDGFAVGDVIIETVIGDEITIDKVEPIDAYPISISDSTINLSAIGAVELNSKEINGIQIIDSINPDFIVDKTVSRYYIYDNKIIKIIIFDIQDENYEEVIYKIVDTNEDQNVISIDAVTNVETGAVAGLVEMYDLKDLGLENCEGKTLDLLGLWIALLKDKETGEFPVGAVIKGEVTDNVPISYSLDEKSITIVDTNYTAKSEDIPAGIAFGSDNKIDADLKALLDKAYFARVIDYEGDGEYDKVILTTKTAYEVLSITTKSNVKYLNYKKVDGTGATLSIPVADVSVALEKGDVFVGAKIGVTLYAEKVEAVETYPTKIGTKTVTLKDAGTVDYKNIKVLGAQVIYSINSDYLVDKKVEAYYIYNGQIIKTDAPAGSNSYNFVILKDIEAEEGFDEATMEAGMIYTATLIIDGEEKKVSLGSVKVNGSHMTLAEALTAYGHHDPIGWKRFYNYTIVADYEVEDDVYALEIAKDLGEEYIVVPAGAKIKYNATTGLYTIDADGNTGTTDDVITKVVLDETSKIFYRYEKSTLAGFFYLGSYTKDTITAKSFNYAPTWGETYLVYDETAKTYTLLATIMTNKIEGIADYVVSYVNDGRLILFAPEDSSTVAVEDELYYSHIFMDNATFENVESINKETSVENGAAATEAGYLYGWVPDDEVYEKITAADFLKTVKRATLNDVLTSVNLIDYAVAGTDYAAKVASSVTIWGLANDADKAAEYKQFTLEELAEMVELIDARAEEIIDNKTALTAQKAELDPVEDAEEIEAIDAEIAAIDAELAEIATIDMLMLYYEDANDDLVLATIIVEVFEADSEDVVSSVNDTIFVNYDYIY